MKLEVGKTYLTAGGAHVQCHSAHDRSGFKCVVTKKGGTLNVQNDYWFWEPDGAYYGGSAEEEADRVIVAALALVPPDYLAQFEQPKIRRVDAQYGGSKFGIGTKPRLSLIPKAALYECAAAMTAGADRYGLHNYRKGLPVHALLDGALRHIAQFADGEDRDEETKSHHLGNAMANLAMAIWMHENKPELDDRFRKSIRSTHDLGSSGEEQKDAP